MNSITVRKSNVELHVPEDQKERYLKLGYSVYDGDTLVEEAPTEDVGVLRTKIKQLEADNDRLKKEVTKLKTDMKKLRSSSKSES